MLDSDGYDGFPPPECEVSRQAEELEEDVEHLVSFFERITNRTYVAFNASEVLCSVQSRVSNRKAPRLTAHLRDRLLRALVLARAPILDLFSDPIEEALAAKGVDATAGLICLWAESGEQRAARHEHVYSDLQAYVRWLRNACHNLCLLQEIKDRAARRRAESVAEILRRAAV